MRDIIQMRIERCEKNIDEIKTDLKELKSLLFILDKNVLEIKIMQEARRAARKSIFYSWRGTIRVLSTCLAAIGGFIGGLYEHFRG